MCCLDELRSSFIEAPDRSRYESIFVDMNEVLTTARQNQADVSYLARNTPFLCSCFVDFEVLEFPKCLDTYMSERIMSTFWK